MTSAANQAPMRVVIVDDERPLATLIAGYFSRDGFETHCAHDGLEAIDMVHALNPDLIVLDVGLPGIDGIEVCRQVRTFSQCYIIMLTARAEEVDTLVGLSVGADDYVTKPFSPRELMARVAALMRRPRTATASSSVGTVMSVGPLRLDPAARELSLDGEPIELTRTEFDILAALARRPSTVLTRRNIIDEVWGPTWVGDPHVVDVHIGHIRVKLGDNARRSRFVRTVRGIGYRIGEGR